MDAFAIPLVVFTAGMAWLLVEIIRGVLRGPVSPPRRGHLGRSRARSPGCCFGIGLAPLALIFGAVSVLALGSLGYWFLATEADDSDGDAEEEPVEPEPGPDNEVEIPDWAKRVETTTERPKPKSDIDWDAFDRARTDWEREITPKPVTRSPSGPRSASVPPASEHRTRA